MPKLYYSLGRASDPELSDPWQVPGKQDKKAERVDVPGSPDDLAAWLNARRVPVAPCNTADEGRASEAGEGRFWEAGPPTREPPRYHPRHHAEFGKVEFVPVSKAAAIAASYDACPGCHRTWIAQVLAGIAGAPLDQLEQIGHAIKERCVADRQSLEGGLQ
jgi:hypothetical protein